MIESQQSSGQDSSGLLDASQPYLWQTLKKPIDFKIDQKEFKIWYKSLSSPYYNPNQANAYAKVEIVTFFYCILYVLPRLYYKSFICLICIIINFKVIFCKKHKKQKKSLKKLSLNTSSIYSLLFGSLTLLFAKIILKYPSCLIISENVLLVICFGIFVIRSGEISLKILVPVIIASTSANHIVANIIFSWVALIIITVYIPKQSGLIFLSKTQFQLKSQSLTQTLHSLILLIEWLIEEQTVNQMGHPLLIYWGSIGFVLLVQSIDGYFYKFKRIYRDECDMKEQIRQYY